MLVELLEAPGTVARVGLEARRVGVRRGLVLPVGARQELAGEVLRLRRLGGLRLGGLCAVAVGDLAEREADGDAAGRRVLRRVRRGSC